MTLGRKTLLTPELQQQIVNTLSVGNTIMDTCAYVGISHQTYLNWVHRGEKRRKGDEIYVEFFEAVTRARVSARVGAVAILRNAVLKGQDTEVARWFLERSDPLNWGRVDTLRVLGLDAGQMKQLIEALHKANIAPGELFEQLIQQAAALAKKGKPDIEDTADAVDWIETHFYIPETNAPIQLVPYQRAVIRQAFTPDESGLFRYSFLLWSDIKKSAKSTIAGALCLYLAWHHAWESVRIIGNDLKQADSRAFFYIERAIQLNPVLRSACKLKNYLITLPNHTTLEAIAVDPKGEAGGGDLFTCFTELWAAKNKAAQQLWSETTLSPLKFGRSMRMGESYAGYEGESPILEAVYHTAVKQGTPVQTDIDDLELYENKGARMLALWNTRPRCPWQTPEYYQQEAAALTETEFRRLHRNEWQSATEAFIPPDWWDTCKAELPPNENYWIMALDAGVSSDCFAVVCVSRHEMKVAVRYARAWIPPKGGELDFSAIESEIRRLLNEHDVIEVAYDPYQLHHMAGRLRLDEIVRVKAFNQGTDRLIADKRLYDLIRERNVIHDGNPVLKEHIMNANRDSNQKGEADKMRIVKRTPEGKIDLVVALSMAAHRSFVYAAD